MAVVKKEKAVATKKVAGETEKYELMVIIRSILSEDSRVKVQQDLGKLISKLGGEITSTDVWGKRHLAYKIDKQSEGYYVVYKVNFLQDKVKDFEKAMKLNKEVLRYLLIKEDNL